MKPQDVDTWYEIGKGHHDFDDSVCIYNIAEAARVRKILQIISAVICQQTKYVSVSRKVPFKSVWAVTAVAEWVYDNHYTIRNYEKFFEKITALDSLLSVDSESEYSDKRNKAIKDGVDPELISDRQYYFNWHRYTNVNADRNRRAAALIGEIKKNIGAYHLRVKKVSDAIAAK